MRVPPSKPAHPPSGVTIDTLRSCITNEEIPLTASAKLEDLEQRFQEHCANRLSQIERGAQVFYEEESSITRK